MARDTQTLDMFVGLDEHGIVRAACGVTSGMVADLGRWVTESRLDVRLVAGPVTLGKALAAGDTPPPAQRERLKAILRGVATARQTIDEAADAVEALAAVGRPAPPPWQPMVTAPKDGTPILGYMPTAYQGNGISEAILWFNNKWMSPFAVILEPTHWMPLPAPPAPSED